LFSLHRQCNNKFRSLRLLAFHFNLPAVHCHDSPALREAETQSAAGFSAGEEGVEDFFADFWLDAGAGVGDNNCDEVRSWGGGVGGLKTI
jgi:hypothetical protein